MTSLNHDLNMESESDPFDERFSDPDSDLAEDDNDESWIEASEEVAESPCLFCAQKFPSAIAILCHCQLTHKFDLIAFGARCKFDCFDFIKFVNFIRHERIPPEVLLVQSSALENAAVQAPWQADAYMKPVDASDLLLQYDFSEGVDIADGREGQSVVYSNTTELNQRIDEQNLIIAQLQQTVDELRLKINGGLLESASADIDLSSLSLSKDAAVDESYYTSYDHFAIHQEMLKDRVRTEAYRQAIISNPQTFAGRRVLDVGCGSGILSLFAAAAGAASVVAVDFSEIAFTAMEVVVENNLQNVVQVLHRRIEDVEVEEKFDVIISEWMGYCLLFECMLSSVLHARDHLLKSDGIVLPDMHRLYLCATDDPSISGELDFWNDVYGFKFSCLKKNVVKEASICYADASHILTEPVVVRELNLNDRNLSAADPITFSSSWQMTVRKNGQISALVVYFDSEFSHGCSLKIGFSTGPHAEKTHWKQTVFLLPEDKRLDVVEGQVLLGQVAVRKSPKDHRALIVQFQLDGLKLTYEVC